MEQTVPFNLTYVDLNLNDSLTILFIYLKAIHEGTFATKLCDWYYYLLLFYYLVIQQTH